MRLKCVWQRGQGKGEGKVVNNPSVATSPLLFTAALIAMFAVSVRAVSGADGPAPCCVPGHESC